MSKPVFKKNIKKTLNSMTDSVLNHVALKILRSRSNRFLKARPRKMAVLAHDYISHQISVYGIYEADQLETLFDFLSPLHNEFKTKMALDIGANIGNHSVFFSKYFAEIHCFEPNPPVHDLLTFNCQEFGQVFTHNCALGSEIGEMELTESVGNIGKSSLVRPKDKESKSKIVEIKTVDCLDYNNVAFMKIDVEGFEPAVLKGARETILKCQPIVVLEQHEAEFNNGTTPSISFLNDLGYRFCWYQDGDANENSLAARKLQNIRDFISGRNRYVRTAESVPCKTYLMLIAIPAHLHAVLLDHK